MSPDDSAVFGAALLSQCFLPVLRGSRRNGENHRQVATIGLETRKRRTDRRYDIFFITPFVPNLRRPRTNTNFIYIYTRPRDYLRAASELKKTRGLFLCPPSPFFSRSRRNSRGRNAETMLRIRFITYEIR